MSWKYCKENVEGVKKVRWDGLWHVMYKWHGQDAYDRVDKATAMRVLKMMERKG